MNHAIPDLHIRIHKVDGSATEFIQHDAGEVKKFLDGFEPAQIFCRERFVFTDKNSITSLPAAKITRIDLDFEPPARLILPVHIVGAVELAETEFQALVRNSVMRDQWEQTTAGDSYMVTFMNLEMADGQRLFLTMETSVEQLQSEWPEANGFAFNGPGLCFRTRTGGVAALNLAHLTRLTFIPKPSRLPADAWQSQPFQTVPADSFFPHHKPMQVI